MQAEVRSLLGTALGFTVDDSTTIAGIFADVFAEALTRMWEEHYAIWLAGQLGTSGDNLAHITQQVGIVPKTQQRSIGSVTPTGTNGLLLPAGRQFRDTTSGDVWRTTADTTIGTSVGVESVEYGPIAGGPSHTYEIVTDSAGWTGVVWTFAATPGVIAETDASLRARHASLLTGVSQASAAGIPIRASATRHAGSHRRHRHTEQHGVDRGRHCASQLSRGGAWGYRCQRGADRLEQQEARRRHYRYHGRRCRRRRRDQPHDQLLQAQHQRGHLRGNQC
ncbi:MAG: hypothetical protein HC814_02915 [Rhodobacteraceae bacterium]|nr:hypothetical protein [Paracoccaceae bacterium]